MIVTLKVRVIQYGPFHFEIFDQHIHMYYPSNSKNIGYCIGEVFPLIQKGYL